MPISKIFCAEEHIIIKLLLDKEIEENDFRNINFKILAKIASSHLIIPLLYTKLKKYKVNYSIPKDFFEYTKKIFLINKSRNQKLLVELKEIEETLIFNQIKYKIIKGASFLSKGIYDNIGDRMIGDIDILVKEKYINKAISALNLIGYEKPFKYKLWKTKHEPRLINKNKLLALEIHSEILLYRHRNKFRAKEYFKKNNIIDDIRFIILNFQINDYGYLRSGYSFRTIYDYIIHNEKKLNKTIDENKEIRKFLLIISLMGIYKKKINLSLFEKFYIKRFRLKKRFKIFLIIDEIICNILIKIPIVSMQLIEFMINKDYRKNVIKLLNKKLF